MKHHHPLYVRTLGERPCICAGNCGQGCPDEAFCPGKRSRQIRRIPLLRLSGGDRGPSGGVRNLLGIAVGSWRGKRGGLLCERRMTGLPALRAAAPGTPPKFHGKRRLALDLTWLSHGSVVPCLFFVFLCLCMFGINFAHCSMCLYVDWCPFGGRHQPRMACRLYAVSCHARSISRKTTKTRASSNSPKYLQPYPAEPKPATAQPADSRVQPKPANQPSPAKPSHIQPSPLQAGGGGM